MLTSIQAKLRSVEHQHGVKIIYACESGSRVWGFESVNSDYDVRFIYVRPPAYYLTVRRRNDVIELPIIDDLDFSGWDVRKALYLMAKSNPVLIEQLQSPTVYMKNDFWFQKISRFIPRYYNGRASYYHYFHMAEGNYRTYLQGPEVWLKKYFYVLRPVFACQYIHTFDKPPPVVFSKLIEALPVEKDVLDAINGLLARKRAGLEKEFGLRIEPLNRFLDDSLNKLKVYYKTGSKVELEFDDLDQLFLQMVLTYKY